MKLKSSNTYAIGTSLASGVRSLLLVAFLASCAAQPPSDRIDKARRFFHEDKYTHSVTAYSEVGSDIEAFMGDVVQRYDEQDQMIIAFCMLTVGHDGRLYRGLSGYTVPWGKKRRCSP